MVEYRLHPEVFKADSDRMSANVGMTIMSEEYMREDENHDGNK